MSEKLLYVFGEKHRRKHVLKEVMNPPAPPCLHVPKAAQLYGPSQTCPPSRFPLVLTRNSPVSPSCPCAWTSMQCGQKRLCFRPQPKQGSGCGQSPLQPRLCKCSQSPVLRPTPSPRVSRDRWCQPFQRGLTEPAEICCWMFKGQVEHH